MRKRIPINQEWQFCYDPIQSADHLKDPKLPEEGWEPVDLPHTWNNMDGQDGGNDYKQGIGWYQKTVTIEEGFQDIYIRFGAVSKKAEVWCNGNAAGSHEGGFSAFIIRLTPYLKTGENIIVVKADNSRELPIYPRQADFTFFGGIYREAELICFTEKSHIDVETFGTDAVFITPSEDKTVTAEVHVIGDGVCCVTIFDAEGRQVAGSGEMDCTVLDEERKKLRCVLKVCEVQKWKGSEDPYLYHAKVLYYPLNKKKEGGTGLSYEIPEDQSLDETQVTFGFRTFLADAAKGFFLNGNHYPLRGVCRHQDRENRGWAITEREHLEDMALIREVGANTIRLAHYQQAPFFYDLCDRNGMIVWAEIPFISVYDERKEADENLRVQLKELIMQNYNHPSICFWGIANEVGIGGESEALYAIIRELNHLAKKLDPGRLTTIANVGMTKTSSPLFHITDVASYNEYMGWYEGKPEDHGSFSDERHNQILKVPLAISEYGAESVLSWHSEQPKVKDYTEEYQALVHEKAEAAFLERPYLFGTWLWNMFDFAADARDEGGCRGRNNKGLVTYDRLIRKQAFYFYKACWSKEPFVYLCGKRFLKRAGQSLTFKAYSNQTRLELWVDGRFLQKQTGSKVFEFQGIELEPGFHEIRVKVPDGQTDTVIMERVEEAPEEYILKPEKRISDEVRQWFAHLAAISDSHKESENEAENEAESEGQDTVPACLEAAERELMIREGYLSVYDPLEEVYRYPQGYQAVQELIARPMSMNDPAMAERMKTGGAMSIRSIWNHIEKMFPDEVIHLLNERLNKIRK